MQRGRKGSAANPRVVLSWRRRYQIKAASGQGHSKPPVEEKDGTAIPGANSSTHGAKSRLSIYSGLQQPPAAQWQHRRSSGNNERSNSDQQPTRGAIRAGDTC